MRPCSVTSRSVTPPVFHAVRRLPALRGLASVLACLLALPLCLPFAQAARADAAPAHSALATVLQLQQMEKQAKAHPAPPVSSPASRLANTPYNAPRVSAPAPVPASVAPVLSNPAPPRPASVTLLDEVGRLARAVAPAEVAGWQRELMTHPPLARVAALHLWLGEYALAHDHQPKAAAQQFRIAQHLTGPADAMHGLAAYDGALALFYKGTYQDANDAFHRLLLPKTRLAGYDVRACALWWRHASACAGYHAQRSDMGIPEPPQLDPFCGVAALAASLHPLNLPSDRKALLAACRVTGEGSTLADLEVGARKLGTSLHRVTVDDKGLIALPKPLIAHVERDHFIAVVRADAKGVSYLCSDCGPWPGGRVNLTWKQWHALDSDTFGVLARPGGTWDKALSSLQSSPSTEMGVRVAMMEDLSRLRAHHTFAVLSLEALLRGHVFRQVASGQYSTCDRLYDSLICPPDVICCPPDGGGPGGGGPGGGPIGIGGSASASSGASAGDPVNLATGAEEYAPAADLTVYNPHGPNVVWDRSYDSLRGNGRNNNGIQDDGLGAGWSDSYNIYVDDASNLVLTNGASIHFNDPGYPNAQNPRLQCSVAPGIPLMIEHDYSPNNGGGYGYDYYVITFKDKTKWITGASTRDGAENSAYNIAKIMDRNGNAINIIKITGELFSITDASTGIVLLKVTRDASDAIASVSDCYGRSVYYHIGQHGTAPYGQTFSELDQVSQVVPTGTANALSQYQRYAYGYTSTHGSYSVGDGPAFLHTITVPSPTGSGTQMATINYGDDQLVSSIVDANGNTHLYNFNAGDANHTQVTVQNASGSTVYSYKAGYNADMSMASRTDGAGNATYTVNSWSAQDPYRPSSVTDGNGRTTQMTWDQYGNMLTETPPSNGTRTPAVTTYSYSYANFPLGEMIQMQEGGKTPTSYAYYEPSGLMKTLTTPAPGTAGGTATVTTSWTYDGLGNVLTENSPGNNAASVITTTFNYATDPGDSIHGVPATSQVAAIDQPLTLTDNLGNVSHYRYDAQGNTISMLDALGAEYDQSFNIANQMLQVTYPATGQTGGGRGREAWNYLYPDGPLANTSNSTVASVTDYDEGNQGGVRAVNYTYGPEGETLSVSGGTEPVSYTYDARYRLSTLSDGNAHSTHYYYKQQGYLDAVTFSGYTGTAPAYNTTTDTYSNISGPDSVRYPAYDKKGNILKRLDGNGVETDYVYNDPESKLTDIQYPASSSLNVHYAYDNYGRRSTMSDGAENNSYVYDDLDFTTSTTTSFVGGPQNQAVGYTYYPSGDCQTMTTPAGAFSYSGDAAGRMNGLTNPYGETSRWTYYGNNLMQTQILGNGAVTTYARNARGQVTDTANRTSAGTLLSDFGSLGYDAVGNCTSVTANMPASPSAYSGTTAYQYDAKNQLRQEQSARNSGYTNVFGYDGGVGTGAGNPTTFRGASHTFNADNQDAANTYDGNGNPTSYKGEAVSFDPENRLTAVSAGFQSCGYSGDSLRGWKTVETTTSSVSPTGFSRFTTTKTYFLYEGTNPICEMDAAGNVTAVNTFGADGLVSRHTASGSTFYTFDAFGNAAQRLNASQAVLSSDLYDAFGQRQSTGGADVFGYGARAGYYTDTETGLCLLTFRYYDPAVGRFLTRDPIQYDGGVNLYGYVRNDPGNGRDPSGLAPDFSSTSNLPNGNYLMSQAPHAKGGDLEPPGTCTWDQYAELLAEKDAACDYSPGKCNPGDCEDVLYKKFKYWSHCWKQRQELDSTCFLCGNSGHVERTEDAFKQYMNCGTLIADL